MLSTMLLSMVLGGAINIDIPADTAAETLDESLDRHAIARARCAAGMVEVNVDVARPDAGEYEWAFSAMPWLDTADNGPFAAE